MIAVLNRLAGAGLTRPGVWHEARAGRVMTKPSRIRASKPDPEMRRPPKGGLYIRIGGAG